MTWSQGVAQEAKSLAGTLILRIAIDDFIPRVSIFRQIGSIQQKIATRRIPMENMQVDTNTLGIRNVVAAVNILDDNLRKRFEDVTSLSITKLVTRSDLRAIPRVVLTRP